MLPHTLAQAVPALPDPNSHASVGWVLAAIVGLAIAYLTLRKVFVADPPLHKEYVTRAEVEKIEKALKDDLTKQAGARKEMHKEISDLQGDVKVLQASTDFQTKQLSNLDGKIDQVLMRLPRRPNS